MWMADCDHDHEHAKDLKASIGPKLRTLLPKPISCTVTTNDCEFPCTRSSCCCTSNSNINAWNQPISCTSEFGMKRELMNNRVVPLVSPRWNPTQDQLQALEELYRRGIRTPSAQQIQQIAAKLRRFGKIEGKNVFYWFQNHKARERQKKRRQLDFHAGKKSRHADAIDESKRTDLSRRNSQLNHKEPIISHSSTPSQDSVSEHATAPQSKNEPTCWQLDLSSCMRSNESTNNIEKNINSENNSDQEHVNPSIHPLNVTLLLPSKSDEIQENQTLILFPIKSNDLSTLCAAEEGMGGDASSIGMTFSPNEFYEFLPTKN